MKFYALAMMTGMAFLGTASAAVPVSPKMAEYERLLGRSPFIIKKPVTKAPEVVVNTALALRGVAALDDGWYVVVVDRKNPKQNIILREGKPANADGLKLVRVNQNKSDYNKTTAIVMTGGRQVTVGYNPADIKKSLATSAKPVPIKTVVKPSPNTNVRPPIPTTTQTKPSTTTDSSTRRPRVRRTVTPTPATRTQ